VDLTLTLTLSAHGVYAGADEAMASSILAVFWVASTSIAEKIFDLCLNLNLMQFDTNFNAYFMKEFLKVA